MISVPRWPLLQFLLQVSALSTYPDFSQLLEETRHFLCKSLLVMAFITVGTLAKTPGEKGGSGKSLGRQCEYHQNTLYAILKEVT